MTKTHKEREIDYLCQIGHASSTPKMDIESLIRIIIALEDRVQNTESEIESLVSTLGVLAEQQGRILTHLESK